MNDSVKDIAKSLETLNPDLNTELMTLPDSEIPAFLLFIKVVNNHGGLWLGWTREHIYPDIISWLAKLPDGTTVRATFIDQPFQIKFARYVPDGDNLLGTYVEFVTQNVSSINVRDWFKAEAYSDAVANIPTEPQREDVERMHLFGGGDTSGSFRGFEGYKKVAPLLDLSTVTPDQVEEAMKRITGDHYTKSKVYFSDGMTSHVYEVKAVRQMVEDVLIVSHHETQQQLESLAKSVNIQCDAVRKDVDCLRQELALLQATVTGNKKMSYVFNDIVGGIDG